MKLSDNTIAILSSFSTINNSIFIEAGNVVKVKPVLSSSPTAKAVLEDDFPVDFGIYEVKKLLTLLKLFKQPELEFEGNVLRISDSRMKAVFRSTPKEHISHPSYEKDYKLPSVDVSFKLEENDLSTVSKSAAILGMPNISFIGDGSNIFLSTYNSNLPKNQKDNDNLKINVGETDRTFNMIFNLDDLMFIKNNYDVELCFKGITKFNADEITYWVSPNGKSTYD